MNRSMVEELNLATEALPGGGERISPEITRSLTVDKDLLEQALHGLTPREREIFQYLACGMSVKDIAAELVLSPYTVYTHLSTIWRKIGVKKTADMVRYALEKPLVLSGSAVK